MDPSEVAGSSGERGGSNANVQVAVRVRPPSEREREQGFSHCVSVDGASKSIVLSGKTIPQSKRFCFDHVADESASQLDIFLAVGKPIADCCLQGYHCCLLAYGQTGAGKTYTMEGPDTGPDVGLAGPAVVNAMTAGADPRGLVPRILDYMFECMEQEQRLSGVEFTVRCSYLQIYNDQVSDLLDPSAPPLIIREDLHRGIFVDGVHEVMVSGPEKAAALRRSGAANRKVAMTAMNEESSRSHSVFTLVLESQRKDDKGVVQRRTSRFYLVDLAGSERQRQSEAAGQRLKEAGSINRSLSALGNVIKALVDISDGKIRHVPYRDSKLTYLLRDALGGNAKCTLIAAISPAEKNAEESLSTLKFVERAKLMRNDAVVNEAMMGNPAVMGEEIRRLRLEIASLRALAQGSASIPLSLAPAAPAEPESERIRRLEHIISQSTHQSMAAERRAAEELNELKAKNAAYDLLVQRLEYKVQNSEMMLKLKTAALKAREAEGGAEAQISESELVQQLEKELAIQRRLAEFNPDVVRFKMELDACKARLREAQDALASGGAARASMGGPGSGVSQDAELAALESLVSDLKKELLEQHEEAEAARADAVAARQDAQECHANMAALEEHVRRIATQAETYRTEVNTSRQQQRKLMERLQEQAQAKQLGSVAEAKVCELVEQLALKELEFSQLMAKHEEQARIQVDLLAELEKAVAEKESAAERIREMQAEGARQKAKMEELGKIEVELLTALEKENAAHEHVRSQLGPLQTRLAELETELAAKSHDGHSDDGASEVEAQWAAAQVVHEQQRSALLAQVEELQERLARAEEERQKAVGEREEAVKRAQQEQQQQRESQEKQHLEKAAQLEEQARLAQEQIEALKLQLKGHAEGAPAAEHSTEVSSEAVAAEEKAKELQSQLEALQQEMVAAHEDRARAEAQLKVEREERESAEVKAREELEKKAEECRALEASLAELKEDLAQATEKVGTHEAAQGDLAAAQAAAAEAAERCAAAQAELEVLQGRARESEEATDQAQERAAAAEQALAEAVRRSEEQGIQCARQEYEMESLEARIREAQQEQAEGEAVARKRLAELEDRKRAQAMAEEKVATMHVELEEARSSQGEIEGVLKEIQRQMEDVQQGKDYLKAKHVALQGELKEAKDLAAKQEMRLKEAESQLRAAQEARRLAEAASQAARAENQRLAEDLRNAEGAHSKMQAEFNALELKAKALEVVVVNVSTKACNWERLFQDAQAQVSQATLPGRMDTVLGGRPWASESPLTDSQLDSAVDGLSLARSWSLGSRKGRRARGNESSTAATAQKGVEDKREAETEQARLLLKQLVVVEAAAESRLCTALAALSAKRAAEIVAKRGTDAEGGEQSPPELGSGAHSTGGSPFTLLAMADATLASEQTDALEAVLLELRSAREAVQKHFGAFALGPWDNEAQDKGQLVNGEEKSDQPVDVQPTAGSGSQDAPSESDGVPESGTPSVVPGESVAEVAQASEGERDSLGGATAEASADGAEALRRTWTLEQARWALQRGVGAVLMVQKELEAGGGEAEERLSEPRDSAGSTTAPESNNGADAASRGRIQATGPRQRWTEEEEMLAVALQLLRGLQSVKGFVRRMAEAVDGLQAQLAEQEEVAARHGETLEELTRLKETAERESRALGVQLQQQKEAEASLETLMEEMSQERERLDRELQEALEGQRGAEREREALQGQVSSLERERVSLEQSEQQCAEQAQVLHQQKMELVTKMCEEGKALQRAREEQKLLQSQLAGEAQRIQRLQHRLKEAERNAQLQRREVAEKQKEAETLSLLLHDKQEELQRAEAEVRKVQEEMAVQQERHEHERQQQHQELTRLEEQAEEHQRRLQEQEQALAQGQERPQHSREDGHRVEDSEAGDGEDEENEEGGERGSANGPVSPRLYNSKARRGSQHGSQHTNVKMLWTNATAAMKAVVASPARPQIPRVGHHSRGSSASEDHRSSGSDDQPPSPLRRRPSQAPSAAGSSKTPRNRGAGADMVPWYQVSGPEGAGVMTRSKKKKLQMSQQAPPEPSHAGADSQAMDGHPNSRASDGAVAAGSDTKATGESRAGDTQSGGSGRKREALSPVNGGNLTPIRGEGYKRSSPKLDRDLVQADRGSKTEGKVRNWLSGHR